jgi:hypothetical protein
MNHQSAITKSAVPAAPINLRRTDTAGWLDISSAT